MNRTVLTYEIFVVKKVKIHHVLNGLKDFLVTILIVPNCYRIHLAKFEI